jgi:tetratricopeptide (TPR) repeat protein
MARVFLSYDREDAKTAAPLVTAFEQHGHSVWWDKHIGGGTQYAKEIEHELNGADVVVVVWSAASVESPWVRDEAAAGRDRGRLVPLSLAGTSPPLGFRQFQSIDLGDWRGRGKVPRFKEIIAAVERQASGPGIPAGAPPTRVSVRRSGPSLNTWALIGVGIGMFFILIGLLIGRPWERGSPDLPVVKVTTADPSLGSVAAANDLFAKLGSLAQVGDGKWRLVDSSSVQSKPDLLFRTSQKISSGEATASLLLLDGKDESLLWSHEFAAPAQEEADLKAQLSLTAGRVLGCALEGRNQGDLPTEIQRTFLDACASLADLSGEGYGPVIAQLRKIVERYPKFEPAWSRLLMAESTALQYAQFTPEAAQLKSQLSADSSGARAMFPNLPELAVTEERLRDREDYGRNISSLNAAIERAPSNPLLHAELSDAYLEVGRMADAISSARKAAELDPLSPGGTTIYIMTLAHGGQLDLAREELAKAEKLWAGTGSLRDAQLAFNVRYGDPAKAIELDSEGYATRSYYEARVHPTPQNISKFKAVVDDFRSKAVTPAQVGWAIQGLGQFGLVDDAYYWLGRLPNEQAASISYLLFRPALASVRRDLRFMSLAKRIGLVDYWRSSQMWPDFCSRPGIPYDCQKEAAKLK